MIFGQVIFSAGTNETQYGMKRERKGKIAHPNSKFEKRANDIRGSQAVTHLSTKRTRHCLTSVIGRELVFSMWYGRWRWYWQNLDSIWCYMDIYIYGDYERVSFSFLRAINISPLFIHQNDNSSLKWVDLDEICEDRWNRRIAIAPLLLDGSSYGPETYRK